MNSSSIARCAANRDSAVRSIAARFSDRKRPGAKLNKMLEMGQSKPWPEAMEALTGQREADAGAILEYFAPLKKWLDEQNKGMKVGW